MKDRLLVKLKSGNVRAFENIISRYGGYVLKVIRNHSMGQLSNEDCEELLDDTFVSLWQNRETVNESSSIMPYLAVIAKNKVYNRLRALRSTYGITKTEISDKSSPSEKFDTEFDKLLLTECLRKAIDNLSKKQNEVFIRFYFYGEHLAAISDGMRISPSDARTSLFRARESVKKYLSERSYSDE